MHSTQAPTTPWSSWLSQELIENMPIGVYVCDHDGVLVAYNKHAATIWAATPVLGDTQKKFCGAHRLFLSDGTYVPHDKTPLARVVVDQQPVVFEARVGRPDGTQVHVQANVSPLFDEQGVFVGFVNCVLDITDRKREDAERVRLAEALHQTQKMEALGQLTSGLAHDFNNLLSAISGNLDLALRRVEDPKAIRQLQNAGMAAERGAKLVSQIMAFSRHQQLESQGAQLNGMISDIAAILERTLSGGVMLSVQLSSEDWAVGVDRNQFELAIMNLVLNARDASPDGGTITIRTEALHAADLPKMLGLQPGDYGRITVSDTGSGIPGDIVAKIFDPFFTTKAIGKGTGLTRTRNLKMARSAHAYVRGSTVQFYEWLDAHGAGKLPKGPPIWICGDCHLSATSAPLADAKGRVDIQIRDLDQTVIGNPAHDLIRLGLSLASAARGSDLPGVITARMLEATDRGL
jgi:PAS domain S-box-containing protein